MDRNIHIHECNECGSHFISGKENPLTCSKCHSRFWDGCWEREIKGRNRDGSWKLGKRIPLERA